jgi:TonB family protein
MRGMGWLAMVVACVFSATVARCADKNSDPAAEAAVARALQLENLWIDGTSPMQVRGEIGVAAKGSMAQGNYGFEFVSPSKSREEIRFGNYERIRVRGPNGYWQATSLNYQPEAIFQLDRLLQLRAMLRVGSKQVLAKLKDRKKDGPEEQCTEVKWVTGTERILCFDKATGVLVGVDYPAGENRNAPEISHIEYSAFAAIGDKQVPREIRAWKDRKLVAQFKITEIAEVKDAVKLHPKIFERPPNGEFWAECDDLQQELVTRVQPVYPHKARANREGGHVVLYAVIETDGSLSHLTIIHPAPTELEAAAVQAVRQWRYKPSACGGVPARFETSIAVDFWIQQ